VRRQKTRPSHPNADPKARVAWLKKELPTALARLARVHPGERIVLYF
jgi:hypothetical protein